ncbi:MAG: flavodoxin [Lachnospiraceae bacterium]|jgi:flavodoxin|nr:flavodoxin [Lachnospiraceae bacterium]MCH4030793.1 flavodoxin [Lachnospiraceae bacterium]MCH4070765.1 flavodoxin [Lachnospiraceae bacterium]MCH4107059.1 flavodoxin [Lachnospiraceae bacterium]MCI1302085.1 flavodoxin [Lachnospiraceae bacterium]
MKPALVVYFSIDGVTAKAGKRIAGLSGAEDFRIEAEDPYSHEDLDWTAAEARCNIEMEDEGCRPAIKGKLPYVDGYGTIIVGYPIWWGKAPRIIDTFLDSFDLAGHTILPFATSGGAAVDQSVAELRRLYPDAKIGDGLRVTGNTSDDDIRNWLAQ